MRREAKGGSRVAANPFVLGTVAYENRDFSISIFVVKTETWNSNYTVI